MRTLAGIRPYPTEHRRRERLMPLHAGQPDGRIEVHLSEDTTFAPKGLYVLSPGFQPREPTQTASPEAEGSWG
jgi:hypothetical protein